MCALMTCRGWGGYSKPPTSTLLPMEKNTLESPMQSKNLADLVERMAAFGVTVEAMPETGKINARQALAIANEATAIMQSLIDCINKSTARANKMTAACNWL